MSPEFPLRLIFSDGDVVVVTEADELLDRFTNFDSRNARDEMWIRDALDRTVHLRVHQGMVVLITAHVG